MLMRLLPRDDSWALIMVTLSRAEVSGGGVGRVLFMSEATESGRLMRERMGMGWWLLSVPVAAALRWRAADEGGGAGEEKGDDM